MDTLWRKIKLSEATVGRLRAAQAEVQKAQQSYRAILQIALEACVPVRLIDAEALPDRHPQPSLNPRRGLFS